ncbi:cytochrome bd oxidase small subunit CydS [Paenibacillus sp. CAA11]
MEFFIMMYAPQLVVLAAVVFLFVYCAKFKDPQG